MAYLSTVEDGYDPDAGTISRLAELPAGQSAYAIARDPGTYDLVTVAAKGGLVTQLRPARGRDHDERIPAQEFNLGAPVLAVCHVGASQVAIADIAGRCWLWLGGAEAAPAAVETGNRVVCSLLKYDESTLIGLAVTGELLFWDCADFHLVQTLRSVAPPEWAASVHLQRWPACGAVAYPGAGCSLVLYLLEEREVRQIIAHRADFYALFVWGEDLLTIGLQDGLLKRWRPGSDQPTVELAAPVGVLAGIPLSAREPDFLLIREDGRAGIYSLAQGALRLNKLLPGQDYRVAVGPSWEELQQVEASRRANEARQLALCIKDNVKRAAPEDSEAYHARLVELGYPHVSLGLRAEQARAQGDLVAELSAYHRLIQIPRRDESGMVRSLRRHAVLLEQVWQLAEAQSLYRRLCALDPQVSTRVDRLAPYVRALATNGAVIETDVPALTIVRAAAVVGHPVTARLLIKALDAVPCNGVNLNPMQIIEKYEQVCGAHSGAALPSASSSRVNWLTEGNVEQVDLVTFEDTMGVASEGLQFGLKVLNAGLQSVIVPVILFDPARGSGERAATSLPASLAASVGTRARSNGWLSRVHRAASMALRRLMTQALSVRNR